MKIHHISNILETLLQQWLQQQTNAPFVAWQNHIAQTPNNPIIIAPSHLPNTTQPETDNFGQKQQGIWQINIHTPIGTGRHTAENIADSLAQYFENQHIHNQIVLFSASVTVLGNQDGYFVLNLRVPYRTL